ncbi:MAG: hypothetical protein JSR82_10930 [Verrucomicrobia bacterium]|nr:hypothetical protein [Verrucomicrobiota bacterium]
MKPSLPGWSLLAGVVASLLLASQMPAQPPPLGGQGHYLLGTEEGGSAVTFNRFQWWDKTPPADGPTTSAFESEFCPPLARVVGDPSGAPAGFAVTSWVGVPSMMVLAKTAEFAARYDYPRSHPEVMSIIPSAGRPPLTALINRYYGPLPLSLPGDNFRPALWLDFERAQRAVGLEFGFVPLPDANRAEMDGQAVHLLAYDKSGRVVAEARGGPISILRSSLAHRIGVRRQAADIWSVKLLFERGSGLNIQDQQALLRVWHEPLPPAAVRQGAVTVGAFNPGGARQGPLSLGTVEARLPFQCDRALIYLRGFWLKYADATAHDTGAVAAGFGPAAGLVQQTDPGGLVRWTPEATLRPVQTAPVAGVQALLYYGIMAWDSQQVELFSTPAGGESRAADPYAALIDLQVPEQAGSELGWGTSGVNPTWKTQTEALRGQLYGALGGFGLTADADHDDIALFGMSVGAYHWLEQKELYWTPESGGPFPAQRSLRWPTRGYFHGDAADGFVARLTGTILSGRSLRAQPEAAAAPEYSSVWTQTSPFILAYPLVEARPPAGSTNYWARGWRDNRAGRQSIPLGGEVAVVGLRQFDFAPGDPFREIEAEIHGANYDGRTIDWQQGKGTVTDNAGSGGPFEVRVWPMAATVRRKAGFAQARLQVTRIATVDAIYAKPWMAGTSTSLQAGIVRNTGEADVLIDRFLPASTAAADRRFSLRGVVWRGETLSVDDFAARHPLQLRPGEELQVMLQYTPDPAWPRNGAWFSENGALSVLTNDVNVATTLTGQASVHADVARGYLEALTPGGGTPSTWDFGRQKEVAGTEVSIGALVTDVGGVPLTVSSVAFQTAGVGFRVETLNGLSPQPVAGQPTLPPRVTYKIYYTFGKGRLGVQTNELWAETNAGRLKLKLRIEVVP